MDPNVPFMPLPLADSGPSDLDALNRTLEILLTANVADVMGPQKSEELLEAAFDSMMAGFAACKRRFDSIAPTEQD